MNVIYKSSSELLNDPQALLAALARGDVIRVPDLGYTFAPSNFLSFVDLDEAEDMVPLRKDVTGIDHTIFVSTKGYAQHAPRIKIAVDPPDSLNAASKSASMALHDYSVMGEYVPPAIVEQAKKFIERNKPTLLDYWDNKIDTAQLIERLRRP
jgi:hypothetical protein